MKFYIYTKPSEWLNILEHIFLTKWYNNHLILLTEKFDHCISKLINQVEFTTIKNVHKLDLALHNSFPEKFV